MRVLLSAALLTTTALLSAAGCGTLADLVDGSISSSGSDDTPSSEEAGPRPAATPIEHNGKQVGPVYFSAKPIEDHPSPGALFSTHAGLEKLYWRFSLLEPWATLVERDGFESCPKMELILDDLSLGRAEVCRGEEESISSAYAWLPQHYEEMRRLRELIDGGDGRTHRVAVRIVGEVAESSELIEIAWGSVTIGAGPAAPSLVPEPGALVERLAGVGFDGFEPLGSPTPATLDEHGNLELSVAAPAYSRVALALAASDDLRPPEPASAEDTLYIHRPSAKGRRHPLTYDKERGVWTLKSEITVSKDGEELDLEFEPHRSETFGPLDTKTRHQLGSSFGRFAVRAFSRPLTKAELTQLRADERERKAAERAAVKAFINKRLTLREWGACHECRDKRGRYDRDCLYSTKLPTGPTRSLTVVEKRCKRNYHKKVIR